jgi:septal ring factor EnvC (AmiA/AmiB activator)
MRLLPSRFRIYTTLKPEGDQAHEAEIKQLKSEIAFLRATLDRITDQSAKRLQDVDRLTEALEEINSRVRQELAGK